MSEWPLRCSDGAETQQPGLQDEATSQTHLSLAPPWVPLSPIVLLLYLVL